MHPSQRTRIHQQKRVKTQVANGDTYAFVNLLTGPEFLDQVESLLPDHRERLFPPTETLSMFLAQAMSHVKRGRIYFSNLQISHPSAAIPLLLVSALFPFKK